MAHCSPGPQTGDAPRKAREAAARAVSEAPGGAGRALSASAGCDVLVLSAAIGEGHAGPARRLAEGLAREAPEARVHVRDGVEAMGRPLSDVIHRGSPFHSRLGLLVFDLEHWLAARFAPTRRLAGLGLAALGARRLRRLVAAERPRVVVSTYPGVTEVLARLRETGRLDVPVVSAISDLASLAFWTRPGVDLNLVVHPESEEEIRALAGPDAEVLAVTGLSAPAFLAPPSRAEARRTLGLPADGRVVVVSGGGWAVGDLAGAVDAALGAGAVAVLVLCGRNEDVLARLRARFAHDPRVRALAFTDAMETVLAASDALVHSTAGLTVLEALVLGVPVVSYGWGRAHIRANNAAFARHGLAEAARTPPELREALTRALAAPRRPYPDWASWPDAAREVARRFLAPPASTPPPRGR